MIQSQQWDFGHGTRVNLRTTIEHGRARAGRLALSALPSDSPADPASVTTAYGALGTFGGSAVRAGVSGLKDRGTRDFGVLAPTVAPLSPARTTFASNTGGHDGMTFAPDEEGAR